MQKTMTDKEKWEADNKTRLDFLNEKPNYHCRFHPTDWWHEVGCPHMEWTKEQLQDALDKAKRSKELELAVRNGEIK